jgi:hypothetical protein
VVKGVDDALLTSYELEVVTFLNSFSLFDFPSLVSYLRKCFEFLLFLVTSSFSSLASFLTSLVCFFWCRKNKDRFP